MSKPSGGHKIKGHQNCSICHPIPSKVAKEKFKEKIAKEEIEEGKRLFE